MENNINKEFLESMNISPDYKSGIESLIPTNAKIFLETVIGGKKEPITIKDFTEDEVKEIKKAILHNKQYGSKKGLFNIQTNNNAVSYSNYPDVPNPSRLTNTFTPQGRIATTLGQFGYEMLSNGDVKILDHYDFMPVPEGGLDKTSSLYKLLRSLGTKNLGENTSSGRSIDLVLPKEIFSNEEYSRMAS
jgi:hypothetical protein